MPGRTPTRVHWAEVKKMAKKFEKLKIELTEENERKFRELHQFSEIVSFEEFINIWIAGALYASGL